MCFLSLEVADACMLSLGQIRINMFKIKKKYQHEEPANISNYVWGVLHTQKTVTSDGVSITSKQITTTG